MIWLLSRLIVWPVKLAVGTTAFATKTTAKTAAGSAKLGYRTGRLFGYRNMVLLAAGVGVGLAVAKKPGAELREDIRARLVDRGYIAPRASTATIGTSTSFERPSPEPDLVAASVSGNGAAHPVDVLPDDPGTSGPS